MANQSGPTTYTGKLASSMNNLRHGSTAKSLFLSTENPEDFFALLANSFEQYQPAFDQDAALVTRTVHDHWMLLRRERTSDTFEKTLQERKPDPTTWEPSELDAVHRFDRYKTEAARSYARSLKTLQTIQKMARDEQKWQHQFAVEKEKLAIEVERWQLLKARQSQTATEEEPLPDPAPEETTNGGDVAQTVYIGYEGGVEHHYETSPTNEQLRSSISPANRIVRTFNFVGGVPPRYQGLLLNKDTWRRGSSTSARKTYSYEEWSQLTANE